MTKITPEQFQIWYLEAITNLKSETFTSDANKSFELLSKEQQDINTFLVNKINRYLVEERWENRRNTDEKAQP